MRIMRRLDLIDNTTEEMLPGFAQEFPCITSRAELHCYPGHLLPWHWHPTAELFFIQEGELDYLLPDRTLTFSQGSGGLLLPNVLHKTSWQCDGAVVQLLHLFDPGFLFGGFDTRMGAKYLLPMLANTHAPILPLSPDKPDQKAILDELQVSFMFNENDWEYEFNLREALSRIWIALTKQTEAVVTDEKYNYESETVKQMIAYIQQNLSEPLNAQSIATAAHISQRTCYRLFQQFLHTTPNAYIQASRIRRASLLLLQTEDTMTQIAMQCGFDSESYFGRVFHRLTGKTPIEFKKWQNNANH